MSVLDIRHPHLNTIPEWPLVHFATHQSGNDVFVTASMEVRMGGPYGFRHIEPVVYSAPGQCVREAIHNLAKIVEAAADTLGVLPHQVEYRPWAIWLREISKRMLTLSFQEESDLGIERV